MRRPSSFRPGPVTLALTAWLLCEVLFFIAVVNRIGLGGAILVGLLTTLLGAAMLRRIGAGAIRSLRRSLEGVEPAPGAMLDGSLAALGAVLLILPGFLSDLVGLALAAPSVRQWLSRRFGAIGSPSRQTRRPPRTIDLGPDDWRTMTEVESSADVEERRGPGRR